MRLIADNIFLNDFSAYFGDFTLQASHTGLPGVVANKPPDRFLGEFEFTFTQSVIFLLLGDQITLSDIDFLILGIARDANDLHAIKKGLRDVHAV